MKIERKYWNYFGRYQNNDYVYLRITTWMPRFYREFKLFKCMMPQLNSTWLATSTQLGLSRLYQNQVYVWSNCSRIVDTSVRSLLSFSLTHFKVKVNAINMPSNCVHKVTYWPYEPVTRYTLTLSLRDRT